MELASFNLIRWRVMKTGRRFEMGTLVMKDYLGGHLKTGQLGTLQNRPVERVQDSHSFTLPVTLFARVFQVESSFGGQLGLY